MRCAALTLILFQVFPYLNWAFDLQTYPASAVIRFQNQTLDIPGNLATVEESFQGAGPCVIHIQDLHCNYEVQNNISRLIGFLARRHGLYVVGIEGAGRPINVRKLSDFPVMEVKRRVADYFVRQGKISGAELYAATGERPIFLTGVEDADHYVLGRRLVESFLNEESQGCVSDLRDQLDNLKVKIYSRPLLDLDRDAVAFRRGGMSLWKYAQRLAARRKQAGLPVDAYPVLHAYLSSHRAVFPVGVEAGALDQNMNDLIAQLRNSLYTSPEERVLDSLEGRLDVLEKMLNISATPQETESALAHPQDYAVKVFGAFIQGQGGGALDPDLYRLDAFFQQALAFYQLADQRSRDFVPRLLTRMQERSAGLSVLITGGYHTRQVLDQLKAAGLSYLSLRPRLSRPDRVNPYFSLLRGRLSPLEKLLAQDQRVMALEPFFAQSEDTQARIDERSLPEKIRVGYRFLETVLKLDLARHLAQQGYPTAEKMAAAFARELAEYGRENSFVTPLPGQAVRANGRVLIPLADRSFFAEICPRNSAGDCWHLIQLNDYDLALQAGGKDNGAWERRVAELKNQESRAASVQRVAFTLLQPFLPAAVMVSDFLGLTPKLAGANLSGSDPLDRIKSLTPIHKHFESAYRLMNQRWLSNPRLMIISGLVVFGLGQGLAALFGFEGGTLLDFAGVILGMRGADTKFEQPKKDNPERLREPDPRTVHTTITTRQKPAELQEAGHTPARGSARDANTPMLPYQQGQPARPGKTQALADLQGTFDNIFPAGNPLPAEVADILAQGLIDDRISLEKLTRKFIFDRWAWATPRAYTPAEARALVEHFSLYNYMNTSPRRLEHMDGVVGVMAQQVAPRRRIAEKAEPVVRVLYVGVGALPLALVKTEENLRREIEMETVIPRIEITAVDWIKVHALVSDPGRAFSVVFDEQENIVSLLRNDGFVVEENFLDQWPSLTADFRRNLAKLREEARSTRGYYESLRWGVLNPWENPELSKRGIRMVQADVFKLDLTEPVDIVCAANIEQHYSPSAWEQARAQMNRALSENGYLLELYNDVVGAVNFYSFFRKQGGRLSPLSEEKVYRKGLLKFRRPLVLPKSMMHRVRNLNRTLPEVFRYFRIRAEGKKAMPLRILGDWAGLQWHTQAPETPLILEIPREWLPPENLRAQWKNQANLELVVAGEDSKVSGSSRVLELDSLLSSPNIAIRLFLVPLIESAREKDRSTFIFTYSGFGFLQFLWEWLAAQGRDFRPYLGERFAWPDWLRPLFPRSEPVLLAENEPGTAMEDPAMPNRGSPGRRIAEADNNQIAHGEDGKIMVYNLEHDKKLQPGVAGFGELLSKSDPRWIQMWQAPRRLWLMVLFAVFSLLDAAVRRLDSTRRRRFQYEEVRALVDRIQRRYFPIDALEASRAPRIGGRDFVRGSWQEKCFGRLRQGRRSVALDWYQPVLAALSPAAQRPGTGMASRLAAARARVAYALVQNSVIKQSADYYWESPGVLRQERLENRRSKPRRPAPRRRCAAQAA